VWGPAGEWDAENVGIAPDIDVDHDPALVRQGKDPQLERAIAEVMAELKKNPVAKPKRPAYPDYHQSEVEMRGAVKAAPAQRGCESHSGVYRSAAVRRRPVRSAERLRRESQAAAVPQQRGARAEGNPNRI
jgi:hypothetical protein